MSNDIHAKRLARLQTMGPALKFARRVFPAYFLSQLKFELHMLLVRSTSWRTHRAYLGSKDLLVNLGAGHSGKVGWVNVDGFRGPHVNCVYDIRRQLPFPDASVRGIFTEHLFEHLDYTDEAPTFLSECYRVMQDNGVLRIIVPDAERYLKQYACGGWKGLTNLRPLEPTLRDHYFGYTYNTRMELINVVFRQSYEHKFAYDFETLSFLLERAGFRVSKQEFGQSALPELCIDSAERESESLYVEAVKTDKAIHRRV